MKSAFVFIFTCVVLAFVVGGVFLQVTLNQLAETVDFQTMHLPLDLDVNNINL